MQCGVEGALIFVAQSAPSRIMRHLCSFDGALWPVRWQPPTLLLVVDTMGKSVLAKETDLAVAWYVILFPHVNRFVVDFFNV